MARPGSIDRCGTARFWAAHLPSTILRGAWPDPPVHRVVLSGVRDPEPPTQVQLGKFHAAHVANLGLHPSSRRAETSKPMTSKICEPISDETRATPARPQPGSSTRRPFGGAAGQRKPELLILVGGRDELVGMRLDPDRDPEHHPGRTPRSRARAVSRSISVNESTMIRPGPDVQRPGQLGDRLVVAVEADPLRRHAGRQRQWPTPHPNRHPAAGPSSPMVPDHGPAEERLGRVEDSSIGKASRKSRQRTASRPRRTYAGVPSSAALPDIEAPRQRANRHRNGTQSTTRAPPRGR